MEGAESVAALPASSRNPARAVLDRLREQATTTPGRLIVVAVAVLASAILFGTLATLAEHSRASAAQAARAQTEPLLAQAGNLYTGLSDANATVTSTLLKGGVEPAGTRSLYLRDLAIATSALATLTRESNSASARGALSVVATELPVYSGLVESARANNRQGFPIGAAYLRQATGLLSDKVLPAANLVYAAGARRLNDDYASGTATSSLVIFIVLVVVALGLLVAAQIYLARSSRRILNLPMLAATLVLLAVSIWGVVGLVSEQSALRSAQRNGSDSVEVLSAARVLVARAQGDVSLTLVNRGSDEADQLDFNAVIPALARLLNEVSALARRTGTTTSTSHLLTEFASYRGETNELAGLESTGQIRTEIQDAPASTLTAAQMSQSLQSQIAAAQRRFTHDAAVATGAVSGLSLALPLLTAVAAVLALLGLRQRINEYR